MKWLIMLVAIVMLGTACSEPLGYLEIEPIYTMVAADGNALPWHEFHTLPGSGCMLDLLGGAITFSGSEEYEFQLSTRARCVDGEQPAEHAYTQGTYTRVGNRIALDPDVATTFTLTQVRATQSGLIAVLTTLGVEYRLEFRAGY